MPSNPVPPSDFKAIVPAANSNICQKLLASLVTFPALFYKWYSWAFTADGSVSDDFKTAIGVTTGQLIAPEGVQASDGTYTDKVRVIWNPVAAATFYEVWRGPTNAATDASLLATTTAPITTYDDSTVDDLTHYWYFVKAKTATDSSGFSIGNSGFRDSSGGGGGGLDPQTFNGNGTYTVPAAATTITIEGWAAGGGGGASSCPFCPALFDFYGGGGGGSGEYFKVSGIPVSGGDVLTVLVDNGGDGGKVVSGSAKDGVPGGPSIVKTIADILFLANGGAGGTAGSTGSKNGAGGAGGTGGTQTGGVIVTQTPGNAGGGGTLGHPGAPGTGGAGGAANTAGANAGGNGTWNGDGAAGQAGHLIITPVP